MVCIYSTFLQRSFDQIFQEVALQDLPVVFCVDRSGFVGADGPTHHGVMDIGYLRMLPNLVLCAPANDVEMKRALEFALQHNHPVAIRYPKEAIPSPDLIPEACNTPFEVGRAVWVKDAKNTDLVIVSYGTMLTEAMKAERILAGQGIDVGIVNGRFAAPVDRQIVDLLDKGQKIITIEDHQLACGFGSAVLELAAVSTTGNVRLGAIRSLGAPRAVVRHDLRHRQLIQASLSADDIVKAARQMLAVPLEV